MDWGSVCELWINAEEQNEAEETSKNEEKNLKTMRRPKNCIHDPTRHFSVISKRAPEEVCTIFSIKFQQFQTKNRKQMQNENSKALKLI